MFVRLAHLTDLPNEVVATGGTDHAMQLELERCYQI